MKARLVVLSATVLLCLLVIEVGLRLASRRDALGNTRVGSTLLMPYQFSTAEVGQIIEEYSKSTTSAIIYDPELGWTNRPGVGMHNAAGFVSVKPDVPRERSDGTLRVAVFAGSYALGGFEDGWWRVLEKELNRVGVRAEVLNFGVAGYGMDQAYLRWKREGVAYRPHVVLFGFAAGNCCDNVNVVRVFRDRSTGIPFTKPRFVIEGGGLRLVNSPTPPPEKLMGLFADIEGSGLVAHDWFYREPEVRPRWWRASRIAALVEAKTSRTGTHLPPEQFYSLEDEPAQVALAITRRFKAEVEASGSAFLVAHLPYHTELAALKATGAFPFAGLYAELQRMATVVPTEQALLDASAGAAPVTIFHDGHYGETAHATIGRALAQAIAPKAAEYLGAAR